ncbi:MAG: hypothetical protein EA417_07400 [Gammaproteobacteria bacterium]|nr:MAG: hypothetical protein EA417_07400 [Gammaproteobacteria bacterium]
MKNREHYDFDDLRRRCEGRWQEIITALSHVDISEALGKLGRHVKCHHNHGKTKQQFRLFRDFQETGGGTCNTCGHYPNGFLLLTYLNGYDIKTAVKEVANYIREREIPQRPKPAKNAVPKKTFEVDTRKVENLKKVWSGTIDLRGTLGERYLRARGITCELPNPQEVRFHPKLAYFDDDGGFVGTFPAIVSLLRSCQKDYPLTIHRIYLDPKGGKANVPGAKKLMSVPVESAIGTLGAAIQLFPVQGSEIAVVEGVETGLAVRSMFPKLPVWAAFSAQVLTKFRPPAGVKTVHIFGDVDSSGAGQAAAAKLAVRLYKEGIKSFIRLPLRFVKLPDDTSGWYSKDVTRETIAWRLDVDGYKLTKNGRDKDHLDVLVEKTHVKGAKIA